MDDVETLCSEEDLVEPELVGYGVDKIDESKVLVSVSIDDIEDEYVIEEEKEEEKKEEERDESVDNIEVVDIEDVGTVEKWDTTLLSLFIGTVSLVTLLELSCPITRCTGKKHRDIMGISMCDNIF